MGRWKEERRQGGENGAHLEAGLLEGAAVGEGQGPGALAGALVKGVEVDGGLLLGHAAGQEHDAGHGGGHVALEGAHGVLGDLLGRHGLTAVGTGQGHGGLQQGALKVDTVVGQGCRDTRQETGVSPWSRYYHFLNRRTSTSPSSQDYTRTTTPLFRSHDSPL